MALVTIPGQGGQRIDARILPALEGILGAYHAHVTAGWAPLGTHASNSDHHWGGAVDLVPGPGGSWDDLDRLARAAGWRPGHGGNVDSGPFRWVGWNTEAGHGRGNHLHLSWRKDGPFSGPAGTAGPPPAGGGGGGGGLDPISGLKNAIAHNSAKILLTVALTLAGAVLVVTGVLRLAGKDVGPGDVVAGAAKGGARVALP